MNTPTERTRWTLCFGALGAMIIASAVVVSAPQPAQAQRRPARAVGVAEFNRACGRCHPNGNEDDGPDLHNLNKTAEEVTKIIRSGVKHMRPIPPSKLSDADLPKVLVFLRSIRAVR